MDMSDVNSCGLFGHLIVIAAYCESECPLVFMYMSYLMILYGDVNPFVIVSSFSLSLSMWKFYVMFN